MHVKSRCYENELMTQTRGDGPCSSSLRRQVAHYMYIHTITRVSMYRNLIPVLSKRVPIAARPGFRISSRPLPSTLIPARTFHTTPRLHAAYNMPQAPKIVKVEELPATEAKWIEFQKISWQDQTGKDRVWEAAARKTRGKAGVDAVAIVTVIRHPNRPPSTIIILQYRPPVDAVCVEMPAGLVDEKESPSDASVRELHEETGYKGKLSFISPTIVSDPGLSTANMQLAMVEVQLKEGDEEPEQALDDGEFIERVVVPIDELYDRLIKYDQEGKTVDARLWHWAAGYHAAKTML
jgi:ADP-ribose pyrophosphatase